MTRQTRLSPRARKLREQLFIKARNYDYEVEIADINRIGIEAFHAQRQHEPGRELPSGGHIRIFGEGVEGNSAPLSDVGNSISSFQKLIDSVGASLTGVTSLQGRLPAAIRSRTKLNLVASPQPGSIIFDITPGLSPVEEHEGNDGMVPFPELELGDSNLADRSIQVALRLLVHATEETVLRETLVSELNKLGPRVAVSLKRTADAFAEGSFDGEFAWHSPGASTDAVRVTEEQFKSISSIVSSRDLAVENITVSGVVRTISDKTRMYIEETNLEDGGPIYFYKGDLDRDDLERLTFGVRATFVLEAQHTVTAGGQAVVKYIAKELVEAHDEEPNN